MEINFSKFTEWVVSEVSAIPPDPLDGYLIDLTKDYPPVDFLLLDKDGRGLIARGDIIGVKGKPKKGKTYACACFETAVLKGQYMGFMATKEGSTILHIDTEQNTSNVAGKTKSVHGLCGWGLKENNNRFRVVHLRECPTRERLNKTKIAIERFKPDFVLIDGIRDLCHDFNDITESANLIGELTKLCSRSKCAILCVLHENKADGNMRGHLGTELLNKCSETYQVTKKDEDITVEQTECRNAPVDKWSFYIDKEGTPQQQMTVSKEDENREKMLEAFKTVFMRKPRFQYTELVQEYMKAQACAKSTAEKRIKNAGECNIIHKQTDSSYTFGDFPEKEEEPALPTTNIYD